MSNLPQTSQLLHNDSLCWSYPMIHFLCAGVTCMFVCIGSDREREVLLNTLIQKVLKVHFLKINYLSQSTFGFLG